MSDNKDPRLTRSHMIHANRLKQLRLNQLAVNGGSAYSAVESFDGVSIRVSMDSSITSLADSVVYDVFVGCRVIQPDGGCLVAG